MKIEVILRCSIRSSAAEASSLPSIVTGFGFMQSAAVFLQDFGIALQQAAQIAVGDRAGEDALIIDDRGDAEAFGRHLVDDVVHRRRQRNDRRLRAGVHQIADAKEALAELSAGMEECEILLLESFAHQKRHRQRVAEGERRGGGSSRREAERTRFF